MCQRKLVLAYRRCACARFNSNSVTWRSTVNTHDKIFVYGTLKTGCGANSILQGRAEFICEDRIEGSLYDLGSYPGFKSEGSGLVSGEVWEITDDLLPRMLDNYEDYPRLYDRVKVQTEKGYTVWVYVINRTVTEQCLIEEGVW
jgi:gamma-glutamylcyclotransferase (GGCT)/AIG2-like uncharacterized protein YtfP